jgi:hypothetical protein
VRHEADSLSVASAFHTGRDHCLAISSFFFIHASRVYRYENLNSLCIDVFAPFLAACQTSCTQLSPEHPVRAAVATGDTTTQPRRGIASSFPVLGV